jgi:two-component system CheB/CheR fusion protein
MHPRPPLHILLVDDHAESVEPLARLLELSGHTVTVCLTAADALAAAGQSRFDLLLSDLDMPVSDGCDLLRRIRDLYPVKAIAITAHASGRFARLAEAAGYARVLTKPLRFDQLLDAIGQADVQPRD